MISPDLLQMGTVMALSLVSMYRPGSFSASTTAVRAWKRFMPYKQTIRQAIRFFSLRLTETHLIGLPSVLIERAIVVQDIDERKFMPDTNFVIVGIVCWGNLDGSCSEFHIDGNRVGDNGDATVKERM